MIPDIRDQGQITSPFDRPSEITLKTGGDLRRSLGQYLALFRHEVRKRRDILVVQQLDHRSLHTAAATAASTEFRRAETPIGILLFAGGILGGAIPILFVFLARIGIRARGRSRPKYGVSGRRLSFIEHDQVSKQLLVEPEHKLELRKAV